MKTTHLFPFFDISDTQISATQVLVKEGLFPNSNKDKKRKLYCSFIFVSLFNPRVNIIRKLSVFVDNLMQFNNNILITIKTQRQKPGNIANSYILSFLVNHLLKQLCYVALYPIRHTKMPIYMDQYWDFFVSINPNTVGDTSTAFINSTLA